MTHPLATELEKFLRSRYDCGFEVRPFPSEERTETSTRSLIKSSAVHPERVLPISEAHLLLRRTCVVARQATRGCGAGKKLNEILLASSTTSHIAGHPVLRLQGGRPCALRFAVTVAMVIYYTRLRFITTAAVTAVVGRSMSEVQACCSGESCPRFSFDL